MERKKEFQYQTERIREYFKTRLVSPDLQKMFLMARTFQWQKKKNMDEADIFDGLPTDLLRQAKNFLYLDLLKKVPLFNGLDDSFYSILTLRIKNLVVPEGFFIFRKGDIGAEMYIIRKGDVEILNAEGGLITVLSDGSSFGEVALYQGIGINLLTQIC
ncbi:cyclic nucleotide-binding-like protein [Chytridium lagenaria]|nr:cyclic nucleotide-binding-like protein [Chytridium lagenaria]